VKGGGGVRVRNKSVIAIALVSAFLLPQSAPAADTFRVLIGDSGIAESRITASFKGSPGFGADIYLQPCSATITTDCIQSLALQNQKNSEWVTLTPDEKISFPAAGVPRYGSSPNEIVETLTAYAADLSKNLPAGGMSPVYKDPRISNEDLTRYLVQVRAFGSTPAEGRYTWNDLRIEIRPVKVVDYSKLNQYGFPTLQHLPSFQNISNIKIGLKSRATRTLLAGWFYGRILQPEIKTTTLSDEESIVQITGAPIVTHVAQGDIAFAEYEALQASSGSALPKATPGMSVLSFGATTGFANGSGAMKVWRLLSPLMKDTASSNVGSFSLRTSKNTAVLTNYYPQGCTASQTLDGVVSTNASMYNPAPPSYEASDGSLNFEVGSPHLDAAGQVIQGVYSLVVSSKLAKCIWGSDLTNSRASVSIINDAGQTQVSTSVLKALNDFYYFHISGFTYSIKKIAIRVEPTPVVTKTPTPQASPTLKKITCVKGKVKKVISGVKPVCPKGYKLK
jgi:hypothetical protein